MHEQSWTTRDRTTWGSGPWDAEPDKLSWTDETTGRPCLAVRGPMGSWCGYVAVDPGHPWHGVDYSGCVEDDCSDDWCEHSPISRTEVHGCLTFADSCADDRPQAEAICHVPQPDQPHDVWWFGFDCAHAGDYIPGMRQYGVLSRLPEARWSETYRTLDYVRSECAQLAEQLVAVEQVVTG